MKDKEQDFSKRQQEWQDFLQESREYPQDLAEVEEKLLQRIKKKKRTKNTFFASFSVAATALLFVLLVNTSPAFAHTIANIPVLAHLAEYVKFDKTLTLALENEYIQEVNLTAWDGDYRLNLPYVLADEKSLILFFQLPPDFPQAKNEWLMINLKELRDANTGQKIEGYSVSSGSIQLEDRQKESPGFHMVTLRFGETASLPRNIELDVDLKGEIIGAISSELVQVGSKLEEPVTQPSFYHLGTFSFNIQLKEFANPIQHEFHEEYSIMGQKIILEKMSIYPTGTEIHFSFPEENTSWIKGLELAVLENGRTILKGPVNGISSFGDVENKAMTVFIESDYFRQPQGKQQLLIKGVRLLNKDEEFLTVDLHSKTITPQIEGLTLTNVEVKREKANLIFQTEVSDNDGFGMFNFTYQDSQGNKYELGGEGMSTRTGLKGQNPDVTIMETHINVIVPEDGILIFQRSLTPLEPIEPPLAIDLPTRK